MYKEIKKRFQTPLKKVALGLFVCSSLMLNACKPIIVKFTPERGREDTEVTITGKRFKDTPAENTVKFSGVTTTNVSVPQKNKIIAKVPSGATTGLISVTTDKGTGYSKKNFIVGDGAAKWTFMVYLDADNNLESDGIEDFLEMASVGSTDDINIVVQMDRVAGHTALYGDWEDTRRFLIHSGDTPSVAPVQNLGEQNMGAPAVLQDFVEWAITNYPAEHYALFIWNHGNGWRNLIERLIVRARSMRSRGGFDTAVARAVATDDTDNDILYMKEVQQALEAAKQRLQERLNTVVKLDVVGFDACLMGMIEVAYALRNVANYMVGSENFEPLNGWPYNTILSDLVATPSLSPRDLAGIIVTKYFNSYPTSSGITQSAIDLSALSTLISKIDNFTNKANTEWSNLKDARKYTTVYHDPYCWTDTFWGVDLWDFADEVSNRVSSADIKTAAVELKNAIDNIIINELHSSDMAGSHGIAIYFPETQTIYNNDPDYPGYEGSNEFMPVDFVKYRQWDNWLQDFYSNTT